MSSSLSRKALLKLSTQELIKKCKQNKVPYNGTKANMVDRILKKHNQTIDPTKIIKEANKSIQQSSRNLKPKKKKSKFRSYVKSRDSAIFLVNGYIRHIEILLNQIVPHVINMICVDYIIVGNIFLVFKRHYCDELNVDVDIMQLCDTYGVGNYEKRCKYFKSKCISDVNTEKNFVSHHWLPYKSGYCVASNVKLPTKINEHIKPNKEQYDMAFICGGQTNTYNFDRNDNWLNECSAYILCDNNKSGSDIYYWKLPDLPRKVTNNCLIYDDKFGLVSIGGRKDYYSNSNSVYTLLLTSEAYKKQDFRSSLWKRKWVWCKMKSMRKQRSGPSAMIVKPNGIGVKSMLIVCGGQRSLYDSRNINQYFNAKNKSVEMLQLDDMNSNDNQSNKWSNLRGMNYSRFQAGICYDAFLDSMYVAGGAGDAADKIEEYDLFANKWLNVVKTHRKYEYRPILWIENNNLLHIAKVDFSRIEQIDLRSMCHVKARIMKLELNRDLNSRSNYGWNHAQTVMLKLN